MLNHITALILTSGFLLTEKYGDKFSLATCVPLQVHVSQVTVLGHILNQNTSQNQEQTPRRSGLWNDLEFISSLSLMHVVGEARLGLEVNIYIIIKTIQIFQELI